MCRNMCISAFPRVWAAWEKGIFIFVRPQYSLPAALTGDGNVEASPVIEGQASGLKRELEAAEAAGGKRARGEA